ncbi:MAG: NHLP leader peptide family RiPP precursor [Gammaproteobacteria bacterium]|nr:NHLP leader peptide family RiPP precursor [Gammaproteobacteria bacterium]
MTATGYANGLVLLVEAHREVTMQSGDDMLKQIVEKSALDSDFRQQLLADPKSTISQELGITIPESMTIQIHESDMQTVHLALPPDPHITEEQLEAISAGLCCCW